MRLRDRDVELLIFSALYATPGKRTDDIHGAARAMQREGNAFPFFRVAFYNRLGIEILRAKRELLSLLSVLPTML